MAKQVLAVKNFSAVPFADRVRSVIERSFKPLVDSGHLELDFASTDGKAKYSLVFEEKYDWDAKERIGCQFKPGIFGSYGTVFLETLTKLNVCDDVTDCKTCEVMFKRSPDELGKAIAYVAVHETAHLFGLSDDKSYSGAGAGGHSGDPRNPMYIFFLHKEFAPTPLDSSRSKKYTIVEGDTISKIARRIGFWPPRNGWRTLYDFKGKDGTVNNKLLKSGNPELIYPGEVIWIPDLFERAKLFRGLELEDKAFTKSQLDTMRAWLDAGRVEFESSGK